MWIALALLMTTLTIDLPRPHASQSHVLSHAQRFNVLACGRRWGKTDMGISLLLQDALDGFPVAWFAPTYKLLEEAWDRFDASIPDEVISKKNSTDRVFKLKTGGQIDFWTLKPTKKAQSVAGRGRKYKTAGIDEAAMAANLQEDWTKAIRPTLTDLRGTAWFWSTPHGQDYFYQLFRKGQSGEPGWASFQLPTSANPFIASEEIDDAERDLPRDAFEQEYLAQFLANAANPFGIDAIRACIMADPLTDSHSPPVCYGVDLAKSHDWVVVIGLDPLGRVQTFQRWQAPWDKTTERLVNIIGNTPAYLDSTGAGDAVFDHFKGRCGGMVPYVFTSRSKQQLMEGLAWAIQNKTVAYPAGEIVNELESFQYEYTASGVRYAGPENGHDDCVCALALAVMCKARSPVFDFRLVGGERGKRVPENRMADIDNGRMWTEVEV